MGNINTELLTPENLLQSYPELHNLEEAEAYRKFCEEKNILYTGGELGKGSFMFNEWDKQKAL